MSFTGRLQYYRRIFGAYLTPGPSHLTFWHDVPQATPDAPCERLGAYYMDFTQKADYPGYYDAWGIPKLDYRGHISLQYNPIAIAQWGLGNYNLHLRTKDEERRRKFLNAAHWLCSNLERNPQGVWVWNHHFDWEYRDRLKAPWYSGLAQGQGISLLLRVHKETGEPALAEAAERAFGAFLKSTQEGGVTFTDDHGDLWVEEYVVSPPTHILNGFIWAAWGIHDYYLATGSSAARDLFAGAVRTLCTNLGQYDAGFWSLYECAGKPLPMLASSFYHRLHIVQLRVMFRLSGERLFADYADRWESYFGSHFNRLRALCYKGAFKLCYY